MDWNQVRQTPQQNGWDSIRNFVSSAGTALGTSTVKSLANIGALGANTLGNVQMALNKPESALKSYDRALAARQYAGTEGSFDQGFKSGAGTLVKGGLSALQTALTASGLKYITPAKLLTTGVLGGGISKVMGGDFSTGAGQAVGSLPQILGFVGATNPILAKYLPKNTRLNDRVVGAAGNAAQGVAMDLARGTPTTLGSVGLDLASGAVTGTAGFNGLDIPNAKGISPDVWTSDRNTLNEALQRLKVGETIDEFSETGKAIKNMYKEYGLASYPNWNKLSQSQQVNVLSERLDEMARSGFNIKMGITDQPIKTGTNEIPINKLNTLIEGGTNLTEKTVAKGPIEVVETPKGLVIVDGHHRVRDAIKSGKNTIDYTILPPDEAIQKYGDVLPTLRKVMYENPDLVGDKASIAKVFPIKTGGDINSFLRNKFGSETKIYDENLGSRIIKLPKDNIRYSITEKDNQIRLYKIIADKQNTGSGSEFVNTLKEYADQTGKEVVVVKPTSKFWNKFDWLKNNDGNYRGDLSYNPQSQPIKTGGVDEIPKTIKTRRVSSISKTPYYEDTPIIRKEENITLYQGSKPGEQRQFWTPNKKYAEKFGDVKEKTGDFYLVDNGNMVTDVYVEVPTKSPLSPESVSKVEGKLTPELENLLKEPDLQIQRLVEPWKTAPQFDDYDTWIRSLGNDSPIKRGADSQETFNEIMAINGKIINGKFMINPKTGDFIPDIVKKTQDELIGDAGHVGNFDDWQRRIDQESARKLNYDDFVRGTIKDGKVNIYFDADKALNITDTQRIEALRTAAKSLIDKGQSPDLPVKVGMESWINPGEVIGEHIKANTLGELAGIKSNLSPESKGIKK